VHKKSIFVDWRVLGILAESVIILVFAAGVPASHHPVTQGDADVSIDLKLFDRYLPFLNFTHTFLDIPHSCPPCLFAAYF
jgi:hypothetical protein